MKRRPKDVPEQHGVPEEEWDVPSGGTTDSPSSGRSMHVLQSEEVAAVRFHTARNGYSFAEVEAFVQQVTETLGVLEQALYDKDVAVHEAREETRFYEERAQSLQATIEVFRAKGDPMTDKDGGYVTESQMHDSQRLANELAQAQADLAQARSDLAQAQADLASRPAGDQGEGTALSEADHVDQALLAAREHILTLTAEVESLQERLAAEETARLAADRAEQEMRDYVDTTLATWLAEHESGDTADTPPDSPAAEDGSDTEARAADAEVALAGLQAQNSQLTVALAAAEDRAEKATSAAADLEERLAVAIADAFAAHEQVDAAEAARDALKEQLAELAETSAAVADLEERLATATADLAAAEERASAAEAARESRDAAVAASSASDDRSATKTAKKTTVSSGWDLDEDDPDAPEPASSKADAEEGPSDSPKSADRLNLLLSAPEIDEGAVDPSAMPMPTGAPLDGLPEPPARQRASLDDAPELQ